MKHATPPPKLTLRGIFRYGCAKREWTSCIVMRCWHYETSKWSLIGRKLSNDSTKVWWTHHVTMFANMPNGGEITNEYGGSSNGRKRDVCLVKVVLLYVALATSFHLSWVIHLRRSRKFDVAWVSLELVPCEETRVQIHIRYTLCLPL